jgi:NAD-dependent dihydropyrimidine dehydrogenase PreA subunit
MVVQPDGNPVMHTRRLLGKDAVDTETGRTRLCLIDGTAHVLGGELALAPPRRPPMPIHERSLIWPENLLTNDNLVFDGVDVSGHWSTFIKSRAITDHNKAMQDEIQALPGGEHIDRCWQCGSCTNACTVNSVEPEFNPCFWIYLIRLGMEEDLLRDKDIIWQ